MKRNLFSLSICSFLFLLTACSGKSEFVKEKEAIDSFNVLAYYYKNNDPDMALKYADTALEISKGIRDTSGEARSYNNIGQIYEVKGEYSIAFYELMQAKHKYDSIKYKRGQAIVYTSMAMLFKDEKNYARAIDTIKKAIEIDTIQYPNDLIIDYLNIGDLYDKCNKYDSALFYTNSGKKMADFTLSESTIAGVFLNNLGNIYFDSAEAISVLCKSRFCDSALTGSLYDSAIQNYLNSLVHLDSDKDDYCEATLGLAKCYLRKNNADTCKSKDYAMLSFNTAKNNRNVLRIIAASNLLAEIYTHIHDSNIKYNDYSLTILDSLYKTVGVFADLSIKEKEIEKELERQKARENNRNQYLLMSASFPLVLLSLLLFENFKKNYSKIIILKRIWVIFIFAIYEFFILLSEPLINDIPKDGNKYIAYFIQLVVGYALYIIHGKCEEIIDRRLKNRAEQIKQPKPKE